MKNLQILLAFNVVMVYNEFELENTGFLLQKSEFKVIKCKEKYL